MQRLLLLYHRNECEQKIFLNIIQQKLASYNKQQNIIEVNSITIIYIYLYIYSYTKQNKAGDIQCMAGDAIWRLEMLQ